MTSAERASGRRSRWAPAAAALVVLAGCGTEAPPEALPKFDLDPARISVSGLSSGAYMAHQVHLAYATRLVGAGLLAGGPYQCAGGDLDLALKQCMAIEHGRPDVGALAERVRARSAAGQLDPLDGLRGDRVYVLHGQNDRTVAAEVSAALVDLYRALMPDLALEYSADRPFAHLFPTERDGVDCATGGAPYLGACGYDAAGALLRHLHPELPEEPGVAVAGHLRRFDQRAIVGGDTVGLAAVGYVYVPAACAAGERCGVHIAFHGCQQNAAEVGISFVWQAGYNRWAEVGKLVVVYPQTRASLVPLNPRGCWDWWGYSGPDYDTLSGVQVRWVGALLEALSGSGRLNPGR